MDKSTLRDYYTNARKLGVRIVSKNSSSANGGYLPYLENIIDNKEVLKEVSLGKIEIPLSKVKGTFASLRSNSFAKNFMPLSGEYTEFATKWMNLCEHHLETGITDPIKVYEYMNVFYVIEGNKRVSVLKYFNAHSTTADVIRLLPPKDESNNEIMVYYDFLKFNEATNLFSVYFTKGENFKFLLELLESYNPSIESYENKYKHFEKYIYFPFRDMFASLGGENLNITSGDAFIEYSKIYGMPQAIENSEMYPRLKELFAEFYAFEDNVEILASPENKESKGMFSALRTSRKKLKVAFIYARSIDDSAWTYSHEIGRQQIEEVFGEQVSTSYAENVPESADAYKTIKQFCEDGFNVIFTTSPVFMKATIKCALEFPSVKFFNCSEQAPYVHVTNYYGRVYEPRFLTGVIAGSLTKTNKIGYAATIPTPEVISSINSFALGVKLVNPFAKIFIGWTNAWNSQHKASNVCDKLIYKDCDLISNKTLMSDSKFTEKYGIYSMLCSINPSTRQISETLAAPVWKWGIFYEKILRSILNESKSDPTAYNNKLVNCWWGLDAEVLDILYSEDSIPADTIKLVELLKQNIINGVFNPFVGPIYSNKGELKIKKDTIPSHEDILSMNWFVDNVESMTPIKKFHTRITKR